MWIGWVIVASVAVAYFALSHRLSQLWVTAPMVFVALGAIVSEDGLGFVTVELSGEFIDALLKSTLALLLFVEAASMKPAAVRAEASLVGRLLALAMPLAIAFGAGAALAFFGVLSFWEGAVVGAILAPTDAALSQGVVSNKLVPSRIRNALLVESGLNDGLAVPLALAFTAAALADVGVQTKGDALTFALEQIGLGLLTGLVLGAAAGLFVRRAVAAEWASPEWARLAPIAVVILVFAGAEVIHGNEFIAAWIGGITFGFIVRPVAPSIGTFSHRVANVLTVISFFVFGAVLLAPSLSTMTWQMVGYGVVSLVLVRPLAVAVGMIGSGANWRSVGFLGWFGPRGIASMILAAIVVKEAGLPGDDVIVLIMTVTVGLSVYLHGLSAVPLARRYAQWEQTRRELNTKDDFSDA